MIELTDKTDLARYEQHTIEVIVDRLVRRAGIERRLTDSLETALKLAEGVAEVEIVSKDGELEGETLTFSQHLACLKCGRSYEELAPRNFSFNSPYGACEKCDGLGTTFEVDPDLIVPNPDLSISEGAIAPWAAGRSQYYSRLVESAAEEHKIPVDKPWSKLTEKQRKLILFGTGERVQVKFRNRYGRVRSYSATYEGAVPWLQRRHTESESDAVREQIEGYMREVPCHECNGARLKPLSLAVTIDGRNIADLCDLSIGEAAKTLNELQLSERDRMIAERVVKEVNARMGFLLDVGLDYLSLSRSAGTLAGGEAQRIRPRVADRQRAGRRALRARRAVDRIAPEGQPPPHRDAPALARPRQHGARRRARRGDHPRGRPRRRHRARGAGSTAAPSSTTDRSRGCSSPRSRSPAST